jgi:hypothetical protein
MTMQNLDEQALSDTLLIMRVLDRGFILGDDTMKADDLASWSRIAYASLKTCHSTKT